MAAAQSGDGQASDTVAGSGAAARGTWMIEYPRDTLPDLPLDQVLWSCFEHFATKDQSNAALHMSQVQYSPITFRLADQLDAMNIYGALGQHGDQLLRDVMHHRGSYREDRGR
jgi:hypothetical protein